MILHLSHVMHAITPVASERESRAPFSANNSTPHSAPPQPHTNVLCYTNVYTYIYISKFQVARISCDSTKHKTRREHRMVRRVSLYVSERDDSAALGCAACVVRKAYRGANNVVLCVEQGELCGCTWTSRREVDLSLVGCWLVRSFDLSFAVNFSHHSACDGKSLETLYHARHSAYIVHIHVFCSHTLHIVCCFWSSGCLLYIIWQHIIW